MPNNSLSFLDWNVQDFQKYRQCIEYKSIWKEEYLKWICGYANANGGILYIGINTDREVVGIEESRIKKTFRRYYLVVKV